MGTAKNGVCARVEVKNKELWPVGGGVSPLFWREDLGEADRVAGRREGTKAPRHEGTKGRSPGAAGWGGVFGLGWDWRVAWVIGGGVTADKETRRGETGRGLRLSCL